MADNGGDSRAERAYIGDHGKPIALYCDKHSVFRVNRTDAANRSVQLQGLPWRAIQTSSKPSGARR
jgi:hypothetical protein